MAIVPVPKPEKRRRVPRPLRRERPIGAKRAETKARGTLTDEQWFRIVRWSRYRCSYCQQPTRHAELQQDHIDPIAKGGKHEAANVCLACPPCNFRKGTNRMPFHPDLPPHPYRQPVTR